MQGEKYYLKKERNKVAPAATGPLQFVPNVFKEEEQHFEPTRITRSRLELNCFEK